MGTNTRWQPFGIPAETWENTGQRQWVNLSLRRPRGSGRAPGSGLITTATVLLGMLAAGLFVVSLAAQYAYLIKERHQAIPSMIEAVGLDVGMAIFSLLALGLAMAGQSARVERALIIACAAGSGLMNYAAANEGSPRSVAAYVMPPVFLAVVVDRVVAVVRRHVLGDGERSAWAAFGRIALYGLRFVLAAPSTFFGLRQQVLVMTPLPDPAAVKLPSVLELAIGEPEPEPEADELEPSRPDTVDASRPDEVDASADGEMAGDAPERPGRHRQGASKTSRFLQLVEDRHGPLAAIDPATVSRIATDLAPEVDLHPGSARSALLPLVRAAQNGGAS